MTLSTISRYAHVTFLKTALGNLARPTPTVGSISQKAGGLFRWNPASGPAPLPLSATLIARLDATFYTDPSKLYDAPATNVQMISGGLLTNYDFGYLDVDTAFSGSNLLE